MLDATPSTDMNHDTSTLSRAALQWRSLTVQYFLSMVMCVIYGHTGAHFVQNYRALSASVVASVIAKSAPQYEDRGSEGGYSRPNSQLT